MNIKNSGLAFIALSLILANLTVAQTPDEPDKKANVFKLPKEKSQAVISYDVRGGFRPRPPKGFQPTPLLKIYPDGRVECGSTVQNMAKATGRIPAKQLQDLLSLAINKESFFEIKNIEQQMIDAKPGGLPIADAPTSYFVITLADRQHECSARALFFAKTYFPDLKQVQQLARLEKELKQIIFFTKAGGEQNVLAILKNVNKKLAKEHPKEKLFTIDHLSDVDLMESGKLSLRFSRDLFDEEGERAGSVIGNAFKDKKKKDFEISVNAFRRK